MLKSTALLLFSFHLLSAAVDRSTPLTRQQRVVCASSELLLLDEQLWSAYKKALATTSGTERRQLEHDEASWEVGGGGCWDRGDCIKKRYIDRIAALHGVGLAGAQGPRQTEPEPGPGPGAEARGAPPAPPMQAESGQASLAGGSAADSKAEPSAAGVQQNDGGIAPGGDQTVPQDATLAGAKQAANQELSRAMALLNQAPGYGKRSFVSEAQDRLTQALTRDNAEEIKAKTEELVLVNREFDQFLQSHTRQTPEPNAAHSASPADHSSAPANVGTGRHVSQDWIVVVLVLLGLDWIYCLTQGLQNRIVLYFDGLDVFVSILGPLLLCASVAMHGGSDRTMMALLAIAGAACSIVSIGFSIKHDGGVPAGCAVALFKLSFSFLWFALLLGQLGGGADERKSSSERLCETFFGMLIALLLFRLMKRLVNGRAVYAVHASQG